MNILYSYVLPFDTGFAPNPYGGALTLATCKPRIRRRARPGDWLVGTGSAQTVGTARLVYAARVAEVVPLAQYGMDERFESKIPRASSAEEWQRHGDNIYTVAEDGSWLQRRNDYHYQRHMATDLSGENALLCSEFWYFGDEAPLIPEEFRGLVKSGPGHKCCEDQILIEGLTGWLRRFPQGVIGSPFGLPGARGRTSRCSGPRPNRGLPGLAADSGGPDC